MIRFVPSQFTAFSALRQHAALLAEAVRELSSSPDDSYEKVRELGKRADDLVRAALRDLDRQMSNYPPREETFRSFVLSYRVFDVAEVLAGRLTAYRLEPMPEGVVRLMENAVACANALEPFLRAFGEGKPLFDGLTRLHDIERQASEAYVEGLRALFASEKEPARLVQLNDVYGLLKRLVDKFHEFFEALEAASWKEA